MSDEIGFIGLGSMGAPMAANLLAAGVKLRVWNRTAGKAAPLTAQGATLAATPAEAIATGGVAITMLADDAAVESVTFGDNGLAARLGRGRNPRVDEHDRACDGGAARARSRRPRRYLRRRAGLRPPRERAGPAVGRVHFGTSGGEGKGPPAVRRDRPRGLRFR